ncbi:hypothetical protein Cgig2_008694 [Carnegiea gigantea]|uniref:POT1A/B-like OB fold domain-containing protein n=1 Tax=Carnegiea gigantea TaxID=171969 RepID=A0A9Q1JJQ5_9CARY|nr:hypothetical protein Cgig2_008694 [Carnegiea gigantea]
MKESSNNHLFFLIEKIDVVNQMHFFCLRELGIDLTFFPSLLWLSFLMFKMMCIILNLTYNQRLVHVALKPAALFLILSLQAYKFMLHFMIELGVTAKFKCIARVVAAVPWRVEDFRSFSGTYRVKLTLEDPTARLHAYVYDDDGLIKFWKINLTVFLVKSIFMGEQGQLNFLFPVKMMKCKSRLHCVSSTQRIPVELST